MSMELHHAITIRAIRRHYNLATPFYRLLWGPHIHHGLWEREESPRLAALQLTERLASEAGIRTGDHVLDVGCGMGGSSIHLAKKKQCRVHGLTLSPVQRTWATLSAWFRGVGRQARFACQDAEQAEFAAGSFDVVWSIECTEHFFNKPAFFERAAGWLKPGGRVAICAWLAGDRPQSAATRKQVRAVCENFLCPSLGTAADYESWLRNAGLSLQASHDWSHQVARTWDVCERRIRGTGVRWLASLAGSDMGGFIANFMTIRNAFESGAMKYGCFIARRA
ncbi:MAG TPA: methyltransferase domain-containing protein [Gemmataceae bacterium]|nr:methyltransferase domain-containing protein [Gemmataceae bacterium]